MERRRGVLLVPVFVLLVGVYVFKSKPLFLLVQNLPTLGVERLKELTEMRFEDAGSHAPVERSLRRALRAPRGTL